MIDVLFRTALTGSAVTLAWLAANALLGKRLPALWHYRVLKLALLLFLVPVWPLAALAAALPAKLAPAAPVTVPELTPAPQIPVTALPAAPVSPTVPVEVAAPVALSVDLFQVLTAVWAIGAAAVLGYKLWVYIRFRRSVLGQNRAVSDPETPGGLRGLQGPAGPSAGCGTAGKFPGAHAAVHGPAAACGDPAHPALVPGGTALPVPPRADPHQAA